MNIAKLCKSRRKELGLTQKKVAEMIGCERKTISNFENGYHSPSVEYFEKLMKVLKLKVITNN